MKMSNVAEGFVVSWKVSILFANKTKTNRMIYFKQIEDEKGRVLRRFIDGDI